MTTPKDTLGCEGPTFQVCDNCSSPSLCRVYGACPSTWPAAYTYTSTQSTMCASCGEHKHTPLRIDAMGGYVCLTCIDQKLGSLLGEFGYTTPPAPQPAPVDELPDLNPEDVVVDVVLKQLGGFAPVTTHGVRVTHKPSCVSVVVDSERSQHRNRQLALEALRAITHHQAHPAPAPVVPEKRTADPRGIVETADSGYVDGWNACIDAMLALRPAVEPMTPEKMRKAAMDEMSKIPALANHHSWKGWPGTWAFATAAVNGITAKAEGGA